MNKKNSESVHQEFARYMRDEMDNIEKKSYMKTERYKKLLLNIEKNLMDKKEN